MAMRQVDTSERLSAGSSASPGPLPVQRQVGSHALQLFLGPTSRFGLAQNSGLPLGSLRRAARRAEGRRDHGTVLDRRVDLVQPGGQGYRGRRVTGLRIGAGEKQLHQAPMSSLLSTTSSSPSCRTCRESANCPRPARVCANAR